MALNYTDQYGFESPMSMSDLIMMNMGLYKPPTLADRLKDYTPQSVPLPPAPAPAQNPMTAINPYYTRQQPSNSFDPMALYQNYKQTGQIPAQQSSFRPYTAPQAPQAPIAAAPTASAQPVTGGK